MSRMIRKNIGKTQQGIKNEAFGRSPNDMVISINQPKPKKDKNHAPNRRPK